MLTLLLNTVLISLSGAMAPGPMTAITVGKGIRAPWAGIWIALGHAIIEFPLMVAIYLGFGRILDHLVVRAAIGILGGLFLLWMAVGLLRSVRAPQQAAQDDNRSPLVVGITLSIGNPYFLIWWATVGAAMLARAGEYRWAGLALVGAAHWTCDLIWLGALSFAASRGGHSFGMRFQQVVSLISGIALCYFGVRFLGDGVLSLLS